MKNKKMNKTSFLLKRNPEIKNFWPFKTKVYESFGKKNKMNKTGGEKLLSIWWVFVLVIIGGGIVSGVAIYHSKDISVNEIEADVLAEKIMNCIIDNGYLNSDFLMDNFDIFQKCNLEKNMFGKNGNFYFNIQVYEMEKLLKKVNTGDLSIERDCEISRNVVAKYYAKCSVKKGYAISENKNLKIIVIGGSKQTGIKL